jgi:uncharacterized protein YgiM (DUF1202 family)
MKTSKAFLSWAALLAAAGITVQAQTPVRVTADNVNLRALAVPTADVVGQAHYDDRLTAFAIGEEWVEIAAPAAVGLWVLKQYVQTPQNTIGANRVNLRAGPSINYNIVATLALGDSVEPRGEEMQDWIKVAAPASAHVWVSRDYVEIVSDGAAAGSKADPTLESGQLTEKQAEIASEDAATADKTAQKRKSKAKGGSARAAKTAAEGDLPTPIVSASVPDKADAAAREIPVPPPANLKLIPLEGQGRITEVEGELRAAPLINEAPTRYRVVRWQDNRWQILCHVYGEAAKFRSLQDKRVRLKGREYWIQGAAAPVLIPDQVQELTGDPPDPESSEAAGDPVGQ